MHWLDPFRDPFLSTPDQAFRGMRSRPVPPIGGGNGERVNATRSGNGWERVGTGQKETTQ